MQFLQNIVDGLYPEADQNPVTRFWWCDTLCVPVFGEHWEYWKAAIKKMRQIYQDATMVVAVDASLLQIPKDTYIVEIYARIKMSSWARRLWTLQEAIVAKDVHIQFADGTRTLRDLGASIKAEGQRDDQYLYTRFSVLANTFFLPLTQANTQTQYERFRSMWRQLQWRATSYAEDEPVCLAAILGLNPNPILDIPRDQPQLRMAKLYQLQKTIPFVTLMQPPPRLKIDGYRWAPSSLLNCFREYATNPFTVVPGAAEILPGGRGISLQRPGFTITTTAEHKMPLTGEEFHITDSSVEGTVIVMYNRYQVGVDWLIPDVGKVVDSPAVIFLEGKATLNYPAVMVDVFEADEAVIKATFVAIVKLWPGSKTNLESAFDMRECAVDQVWHLH